MAESFFKANKYFVIICSLIAGMALFMTAGYLYVERYPAKKLSEMVVKSAVDLVGASFQRVPKCSQNTKTRRVQMRRRDQLGGAKCFDRLDFKQGEVEVIGLKGSETLTYWTEESVVKINLRNRDGKPVEAAAQDGKKNAKHQNDKDIQIYVVRDEGALLQGMYGGVYRKIEKSQPTH